MDTFCRLHCPELLVSGRECKVIAVTTYRLITADVMIGNHTLKRVQKASESVKHKTEKERKRKRNVYHCWFDGCAQRVTQKQTLRDHYKRKHECDDERMRHAWAMTGKQLICRAMSDRDSCMLCAKRSMS